MSRDRRRITNLISGDVVIEDLGVRLRGRGSWQEVPAAAAAASRDLIRCGQLVKVEVIRSSDHAMPFWPFLRDPPPAPAPVPAPSAGAEDLSEIRRHVAGIESALRELLERPAPAHPEVLAAHLRAIGSRPDVPAGLPGAPNLPGPGAQADPVFIPSRIVPDSASARIKVREEEVAREDLEDGVAALRKARGKG